MDGLSPQVKELLGTDLYPLHYLDAVCKRADHKTIEIVMRFLGQDSLQQVKHTGQRLFAPAPQAVVELVRLRKEAQAVMQPPEHCAHA